MPVLIDFGGVKQVEVTVVSKFTNREITYWEERKATPRGTVATGQVFPNSDLYALAVTALVLLTGKEPKNCDSWNLVCNGKLALARNWKQCCRKWVSKSGDRQSAEEVLKPCSPTPLHRRQTSTSPRCVPSTLSDKTEPNASYSPKTEALKSLRHPSSSGCFALGSQGCRCRLDCIGTNAWGLALLSDSFNTVIACTQHEYLHSSSENTRGQNS